MSKHRVVAGALMRNRRVLLAHRCAGRRWYPDVWDFPGGHVRDGEVANAAPDEHDQLRWVGAADLAGSRLALPAYAGLIRRWHLTA